MTDKGKSWTFFVGYDLYFFGIFDVHLEYNKSIRAIKIFFNEKRTL